MDAIASNPLSLTQDERKTYAFHVFTDVRPVVTHDTYLDLPLACTIVCFGDPSRLRTYRPIWRAMVALYVQTTNPLRTYENVPVAERQAVLADLHRAVEPYKRDIDLAIEIYKITAFPQECHSIRKVNGIWTPDRFPVCTWLRNQNWLEPRLEV